ncbi:MAG: hypothetical protein AABZ05_01685 [Nitrospirota bacterium]
MRWPEDVSSALEIQDILKKKVRTHHLRRADFISRSYLRLIPEVN